MSKPDFQDTLDKIEGTYQVNTRGIVDILNESIEAVANIDLEPKEKEFYAEVKTYTADLKERFENNDTSLPNQLGVVAQLTEIVEKYQ